MHNAFQRKRKCTVLKPGIWADVLNSLVWNAIKWPCSWSLKGNYISVQEEAKFWILVRAKCACGNNLRITWPNPPPTDPKKNGVALDVLLQGTKDFHDGEKIRHRPLRGEKRRRLGEDMIDKHILSTRMRKDMASGIMELCDPYPSHLPTNEVGRQIQKETLTKRRIDTDPIKCLQLLKYSANPVYCRG